MKCKNLIHEFRRLAERSSCELAMDHFIDWRSIKFIRRYRSGAFKGQSFERVIPYTWIRELESVNDPRLEQLWDPREGWQRHKPQGVCSIQDGITHRTTLKTIYKYPILTTDKQLINMPRGAQPLCVQVQAGVPTVWAAVDSDAESVPITFVTYGTGDELGAVSTNYVGTYQLSDGLLVYHVFCGR